MFARKRAVLGHRDPWEKIMPLLVILVLFLLLGGGGFYGYQGGYYGAAAWASSAFC
jgi:hypothetical protein